MQADDGPCQAQALRTLPWNRGADFLLAHAGGRATFAIKMLAFAVTFSVVALLSGIAAAVAGAASAARSRLLSHCGLS